LNEDGMSAESAQREPTMEEILASIRRIISEEDKPGDAGEVLDLKPPPAPVAEVKAPIVAPAPAPKPAPIPEPPKPAPVAVAPPPPAPPPPAPAVFEEPEEIVPSRPLDDELMIVEKEPEPAPKPVAAAPKPAPQPEWTPPPQPSRPLVSDPVANQTSNALGRLMGSMMVGSGNTLDDVVRELLKPLLKEWLDANLPQLVEAEVAKEIDRIRRMSR
jgi:cell pole-organizing protein PopZ